MFLDKLFIKNLYVQYIRISPKFWVENAFID